LLSPAEELRLLDSLQGGHGLIKALYSTRTAQTQSTAFTESQLTVLSDAKLGTNTDVLTTHANLLYAKGQYAQSLQFTQRYVPVARAVFFFFGYISQSLAECWLRTSYIRWPC